jgi:hypothetical protein
MPKLSYLKVIILVSITLCINCGIINDVKKIFRDPSIEPLREVIRTTIPLSYAASLAMAAAKGQTISNVTWIQKPSGSVGSGLLSIKPDNAYPLAIPTDTSTRIGVAGIWTDSTTAILSVFFINMHITAGSVTISHVSTVPVTYDSSDLLIVYAAEDINAGSDTLVTFTLTQQQINTELTRLQTRPPLDSTVTVNQLAWVVTVNQNNTPANFADDNYLLAGAGQSVDINPQNSDMEIVQLVMFAVKMTPSCRLNPGEGYAILKNTGVTDGQAINVPFVGTAVFDFHPSCNNRVDIAGATGVYLGANNKSVLMNLN